MAESAPRASTIDVEAGLQKPAPQPAAAPAKKVGGNPGPLGLFCFGITTLMLMYVEAKWISGTFAQVVVSVAIIYGGIAQIFAGMWEMWKGSTFAALAFTSYGCFWMSFAILQILNFQGFFSWNGEAVDFEKGQALFLGTWGFFTFCMALLLFKKPRALQITFWLLFVAFMLLTAGAWHENAKQAGGYVGLLCALGAIYTAMGELVEEIYGVKIPLM